MQAVHSILADATAQTKPSAFRRPDFHIPPLPAAAENVHRLMRALEQPAINLAICGDIAASDPALAATVLHLGTTCALPFDPNRFSLTDYVVAAGKELLLGACAQLDTSETDQLAGEVRQHSVLTACIAAALAPSMRVDPSLAYVAGLLHDLGRLAARASLGSRSPAFYTSIGAELARQLTFPSIFVNIISGTSSPTSASCDLAVVVRCACESSQVQLASSQYNGGLLVC